MRDIISLYNEIMETNNLLCNVSELQKNEFFEKNSDEDMENLERLLKKLNGVIKQILETNYEKY